MEKRDFRPRTRKSGFRDSRLIIIATEGTKTEKIYFEDVAKQFSNPKVHVEVLTRDDTASSPERVLRCMNDFQKEYNIRKGYDEFWLVIDVDRWHDANLSRISRLSHQKGFELAVSNPCFEIWLLLHLRSLDIYSNEDRQAFLRNDRDQTNRTRIDRELVKILGNYNKSNLCSNDFIPYIDDAINRARSLDIDTTARWPNQLGTRVYLLVLQIIPQN